MRRELCGVRGEGVGCPVQLMHRVLQLVAGVLFVRCFAIAVGVASLDAAACVVHAKGGVRVSLLCLHAINRLCLRDAATGKRVQTLEGHTKWVRCRCYLFGAALALRLLLAAWVWVRCRGPRHGRWCLIYGCMADGVCVVQDMADGMLVFIVLFIVLILFFFVSFCVV